MRRARALKGGELKRGAQVFPSATEQIDDGALVPVSYVKRKTHRSLPTTINGRHLPRVSFVQARASSLAKFDPKSREKPGIGGPTFAPTVSSLHCPGENRENR